MAEEIIDLYEPQEDQLIEYPVQTFKIELKCSDKNCFGVMQYINNSPNIDKMGILHVHQCSICKKKAMVKEIFPGILTKPVEPS